MTGSRTRRNREPTQETKRRSERVIMTQLLQENNLYLAHFEEFEKAHGASDTPWLRRIRKSAIARFGALGFPGPRHEDWRFTNLAALAKTPFQPAAETSLEQDELSRLSGDIGDCHRLVCANGRFAPELSSLRGLPGGVIVTGLAKAIVEHANLVEPHLARHARFEDHALTALNTAFIGDGAFVYVPKGIVLDRPIHLIHVSQAAGEGVVSHPRNLVIAGANSQATIIEQYAGPEDDVYFS